MKKIIYIIAFSFLGVLVGFLIHTLVEWPMIFLLDRNFVKYSFGFTWAQWFVIHNVGTALLLFAGGLFGLSQGFFWWRILYVEKRRFGHHRQAIVLDSSQTLFDDAGQFINRHKSNFDIIIFAPGTKNSEEDKARYKNLPPFVKIIQSSQSPADNFAQLLEDYTKVHFITSKLPVINKVKNIFPEVTTYLVIRLKSHLDGEVESVSSAVDKTMENLDFEVNS